MKKDIPRVVEKDQKHVRAFKLKLSTGKIVILREPSIFDIEDSSAVAGTLGSGNMMKQGLAVQKELTKRLLLEIDGRTINSGEKEAINSLFNLKEYLQITKYVNKITTGDDEDPEVETLLVKSS